TAARREVSDRSAAKVREDRAAIMGGGAVLEFDDHLARLGRVTTRPLSREGHRIEQSQQDRDGGTPPACLLHGEHPPASLGSLDRERRPSGPTELRGGSISGVARLRRG